MRQAMKLHPLTHAIRYALMFWLLAMLCAFGSCSTKPDLPRGVIIKPQAVEVIRTVYVNVPAEFTDQLPIAEGPLSMCPDVAADRREALKKANADRRAVRALSGTQVKP